MCELCVVDFDEDLLVGVVEIVDFVDVWYV